QAAPDIVGPTARDPGPPADDGPGDRQGRSADRQQPDPCADPEVVPGVDEEQQRGSDDERAPEVAGHLGEPAAPTGVRGGAVEHLGGDLDPGVAAGRVDQAGADEGVDDGPGAGGGTDRGGAGRASTGVHAFIVDPDGPVAPEPDYSSCSGRIAVVVS